jgi:2'-5' RNA ligase
VLRTAVIVPVPEAAGAVDPWRERTSNDKPSRGVPAHVTLLFPFVPAADVDAAIVEELRRVVGAAEAFAFGLREARRFPGVLYLAPDPPEPFVRLTEAIADRWPRHPPYEGAFETVVPHLTVAQGDAALLDEAETVVRPALPIHAQAREALLLEEVEPEWRRWETRARLPLRS